MPILLALAAAAVSPQPGELKTFKNWIVGCDDRRACQAVDEAGKVRPPVTIQKRDG